MPDLRPDFLPGDVLTADLVNQIIEGLGIQIRGGPGVNVRHSGRGIQINGSTTALSIFKGKVATGGITARSSDATHGSGNVEVWIKSNGSYVDSGTKVAVDYISSTTGGLSAGVWVNCAYKDDGTAEIISVDCGN